ncbi:hypothetical protein CIPAW_15G159500 [Carya illinoinensis]|uniref:Uncharacterized protein n=1 Tax=Carya illinoinensis TaxID=32201 RepID=A0A8T1NE19_CARIL|nr:hypothetical protein CIPAW_15G159500 [Carya illinoinensis]
MPLSKTSKVDLRKQDEVPVDATLCKNNNIKAFCPVESPWMLRSLQKNVAAIGVALQALY